MDGSSFKERVRVRVNGILIKDGSALLAQIHSPVSGNLVWIPPGGGLEYRESLETGLIREFREETGLNVRVGSLQYINELIQPPFHAIEFYFYVRKSGGRLKLGRDPELAENKQILRDLRWIAFGQMENLDIVPAGIKKLLLNHEKEGTSGVVFNPSP